MTRLSHWLGRPSHINDRQFSVAPVTVDDFEAGVNTVDDYLSHSIAAFVTISRLTTVLSTVLDSFYTINRNPCAMTPEEALFHASQCQAQLSEYDSQQGSGLLRPSRVINGETSTATARKGDNCMLNRAPDYAFVFAYYGIAVSIQRALFACVGGTSYYDIERETLLFQDLFGVFEDLLEQDLDGLWLSCKQTLRSPAEKPVVP